MRNKILGTLVLAGFAAAANAEEVKAVKKSAGQQVSDNLYGDVEARVQTFDFKDKAGDKQASRNLVFRPKLGTKIMNEKLDLNLTTPVTNKQQSAKSQNERPELETNLNLYDSDLVSLDIYTFHYLAAGEGKEYDGYADLDITVKHDFVQSFGKIETSLLFEPEANLTAKDVPATSRRLERDDGTALADTQPTNAPAQRETAKAINVYPLVYVHPSALPGFKVGLGAILATTYNPRYKSVVDGNNEQTLQFDGYDMARSTQVRYTVKYQINESVSVYNQLRQNLDGYADAGLKTGARIDNRTGITMKLF